MTLLMGIVDNIHLRSEVEDSLCWTFINTGTFTVQSHKKKIGEQGVPSPVWRLVWKMKIPSNVFFFSFLWTACRERLPTIDLLQRRGMHLPNVCSLSLREEETINHILMHCSYHVKCGLMH